MNEDLIVVITSLSTDGAKFYKERKFSEKEIKLFSKEEKEKKDLVRDKTTSYNTVKIKTIWGDALKALLEYVTLDGRCTRYFSYHFAFLNHF